MRGFRKVGRVDDRRCFVFDEDTEISDGALITCSPDILGFNMQSDVFAFMRTEHDAGDEDLRELDEDAECPMCNQPLIKYSGRHKDPRYHGRNVCFPLPSEAWEDRAGVHLRAHADLRVHNHWRCVHQAEAFVLAQTARVHRRPFEAT